MRNELLTAIVLALGGAVRNENNRNMLLEDWLDAVGGGQPPIDPPPVAGGGSPFGLNTLGTTTLG